MVLIFTLFMLLGHECSIVAEGKRLVLGFTLLESSGIDKYDAEVLSRQVRKEIEAAGVYRTIEFSEISLRLAEQNLPGRCADVQCAIVAGQLLGADFFAIGSIDKIGKTYAISMQLVEVRSGRIVRNVSEFYKGKLRKFEKNIIPLFARKISGLSVEEKK